MPEDIDAPSETDPSRAVMERREEIARIVRSAINAVLNTEHNPSFNLNIAGAEIRRAVRKEAPERAADAIMALPSPAPVAGEGKALGIALAALQHIQGMEPITHEITLATVMAQHAVDALNEIRELGAASCPNPCDECRGTLRPRGRVYRCDRCGWEVE